MHLETQILKNSLKTPHTFPCLAKVIVEGVVYSSKIETVKKDSQKEL